MIYNATIAEDQEKLWDNKQVQEALRRRGKHIINALDVIDAVLLPGEKENVLTVLDELSGYDTEEAKVETAKTYKVRLQISPVALDIPKAGHPAG